MLIRGPIFLLLPIACLHLRACFPPSRKTPIVMIRMSAKMDLTKAQHCSMICYGMLLFDRAQWEVWCFLGICLKITKPIHLSLTKFKNDIHLEVFHHHFNKPAKLRRCGSRVFLRIKPFQDFWEKRTNLLHPIPTFPKQFLAELNHPMNCLLFFVMAPAPLIIFLTPLEKFF